ncbi:tRNA pseudouridine(55) synthase TruB [Tumebacillus algifaecis]|uniref:tRNA pseudouridine synthase B n=1 Tax=Tumebacillus algifaecis TaxID=1214604 RepID=A0A223D1G8_9BACL|nr:tRNA pseudouridine(55) synthase TruB [Tumebacillus algifaecis]ASS75599.1 tRNA pseudouridine(55) synthase TruB [Tumebacillus algifaecis]
MMHGILVINKPAGMTSHQVVGRARRILGIKKIGHTGTLDPDVQGVLPICIGMATRVAEYLLDQTKAYRGEVTFGLSTTTQDASGEPIEAVDEVLLTAEQVRDAFAAFLGPIMQRPPAYSAIKIDGKRAYDLARKGADVEIPPREVTLYKLEIEEMQLDLPRPKVRFYVECSKGTYVRTLCHDLGVRLGVPAHMSSLLRTKSGPFDLSQALTFEEIEEHVKNGTIEEVLLPMQAALPHLPQNVIPEVLERRVDNGRELTIKRQIPGATVGSLLRIESRTGKLLALYRVTDVLDGELHTLPEKVFKE